MENILQDQSTRALVRAIKNNLYEFFRGLRLSPRAEFFESEGVRRWHTPILHPWFNGALSLKPAARNEGPLIEETLSYFSSKDIDTFTWWLDPDLLPSDWSKQLLPYGFKYAADTPGMAADLSKISDAARLPPGLIIRTIDSLEMFRDWCGVFVRGYGLPTQWEADLFDIMSGMGFEYPLRNYLGYLEDKPIATSSAYFAAGVAGIYNVATLPEARGMGIGTAMTLLPLQYAREKGYQVGVLQSSEMGFGVYRKLGFENLCEMDHFYWQRSEVG